MIWMQPAFGGSMDCDPCGCLTDAHIHYADERVGERYGDLGSVRMMFCCSAGPDDWQRIWASDRPGLTRFYGVHPWEAAGWSDSLSERLEAILGADPAAGVGEIGLDSKNGSVGMDVQIDVFSEQLDMAERYGRIVNIHSVGTDEAVIGLLRGRRIRSVIHGFSNESFARQYCRYGSYLSVNPRILARSDERVRRLIASIPADRLLLESDAPFSPRFVGMTDFAERLSTVMGVGREELLSMTSANMERLSNAGNGTED